jgi:hypothetical protein
MYDRNPGTPLRQTISMASWDGFPIMTESRPEGGIAFPRQQIPMNRADGIFTQFPHTANTSVTTLFEGRFSGTGTQLHARLWGASDAGVTGEVRVRCVDGSTVVTGPWNAIPAAGNVVFDSVIDVTALRGHLDTNIFVDAHVLTGSGNVYCAVPAMTNYSD